MVLLEFSMSPMDKGESLSEYVARIVELIDQSGITYRLTPMGTILEGEWDEVFSVVGGCFKLLKNDCSRISVNIKVDYRGGKESRLESKINKIESILGREVRK